MSHIHPFVQPEVPKPSVKTGQWLTGRQLPPTMTAPKPAAFTPLVAPAPATLATASTAAARRSAASVFDDAFKDLHTSPKPKAGTTDTEDGVCGNTGLWLCT